MIRRHGLLAIVAFALLAFDTSAWAQAPVKLNYATYLSNNSTITKTDIWFMEEVTKRSNGRITFEPYFSGALLNAKDLFPGLERGAVDFATGTPATYNPKEYPLSSVVLPYITDKADAVTKAFGELVETNAALREEYRRHNLRFLWTLAFPEGTLWSNKRIDEAKDLKGLRVRATLGVADALSMLGATVVPLSHTDGMEALKRGAIDAFASSPFDSAVINGLNKIAAFGSDGGRMGIYAVSTSAINQRKFESLDAEAKRIILEVAAEAPAQYLKLLNEVIEQAADKLAKSEGGAEIVRFNDEQVRAWREATAGKVQEKWLSFAKSAGVDGKPVLEQFVALVRQYEPASKYVPGFELYARRRGL